jgi:uncharacterized protein
MKMQADRVEGGNAIARHGPHGVIVGGSEYRSHVVVPWQGEVRAWPVSGFDALDAAHFELLAALVPELVIFGSGSRLRFLSPAVYAPLIAKRIGIETMDTPAACRTYNVLLAEGRSVIAALLFDTPS